MLWIPLIRIIDNHYEFWAYEIGARNLPTGKINYGRIGTAGRMLSRDREYVVQKAGEKFRDGYVTLSGSTIGRQSFNVIREDLINHSSHIVDEMRSNGTLDRLNTEKISAEELRVAEHTREDEELSRQVASTEREERQGRGSSSTTNPDTRVYSQLYLKVTDSGFNYAILHETIDINRSGRDRFLGAGVYEGVIGRSHTNTVLISTYGELELYTAGLMRQDYFLFTHEQFITSSSKKVNLNEIRPLTSKIVDELSDSSLSDKTLSNKFMTLYLENLPPNFRRDFNSLWNRAYPDVPYTAKAVKDVAVRIVTAFIEEDNEPSSPLDETEEIEEEVDVSEGEQSAVQIVNERLRTTTSDTYKTNKEGYITAYREGYTRPEFDTFVRTVLPSKKTRDMNATETRLAQSYYSRIPANFHKGRKPAYDSLSDVRLASYFFVFAGEGRNKEVVAVYTVDTRKGIVTMMAVKSDARIRTTLFKVILQRLGNGLRNDIEKVVFDIPHAPTRKEIKRIAPYGQIQGRTVVYDKIDLRTRVILPPEPSQRWETWQ